MPKSINLLKGYKKEELGSLQRLFNWTISGGKSTIIVIEILVITVLLVKFGLEKNIERINAEISEKLETIDSYQDLEKNLRDYQKRLFLIEKVTGGRKNFSGPLKSISKSTPQEVVIKNILITPTTSNITAQTSSTKAFAILIRNLLDLNGVKEVILKSAMLEPAGKNEYTFVISLITDENFL